LTSDDKKYIILMYKLILVGRLQSLRVISGLARGLKLSSIDGMETRPTLDRVKEPLFSMLMPYLNDANVLDLFAGSGALGIEAISRGALKCTFTDKNPKCVKVILDNVKKARMEEKSIVKNISFESFLATSKEKFDLVFLDPPYKMGLLDEILSKLKEGHLNDDAIVAVEADDGTNILYDGYTLLKERKYGRVKLFILQLEKEA